MNFPYEGDLVAVFEAVTIPRVFRESLDTLCGIIGVPTVDTTDIEERMRYERATMSQWARRQAL